MTRKKKTAKRKTVKRKALRPKRKTLGKPKFKIGDFVYSSSNPTEKRQVIEAKPSTTKKALYRLLLSDAKGRPKKSTWIAEKSITKTKRK